MTALLALLLLVAPQDDTVQALLRQLGDDVPRVRSNAVSKLTAKGRAILPELETALSRESDLEVKARIAMVFRYITQPRWFTDVPQARIRAELEAKPLMVFSTPGPLTGFV